MLIQGKLIKNTSLRCLFNIGLLKKEWPKRRQWDHMEVTKLVAYWMLKTVKPYSWPKFENKQMAKD